MEGSQTGRGRGLLKTIGPGVMYAGAAIGVSHLVQSTRAGANYGFALIWVVLAVNLCKYPFFEFAQRYAAATGDNVFVGYRKVGKWALVAYLLVSFGSGMPTVAAVTLVSAGLAAQLFAVEITAVGWSIILAAVCVTVLALGGYPWLDRLMKTMMAFLAVCTVVAVVVACVHGSNAKADFVAPPVWDKAGIVFLIALMGWMPTPVDISAWPSLWMQERTNQTGHRPTLREALFDFNLGYIATAILAVMFLSLGALVMHGTGEAPAAGAAGFGAQLVRMYTASLGGWAKPFIVIAAFTCMLSTTITVIDGYPRVLRACVAELGFAACRRSAAMYWAFMLLLVGSALAIIAYFSTAAGRMKALVDFVTTIAFLTAPLLAYINWRMVRRAALPPDAQPPRWLWGLSGVGMVFLVLFSMLFLWW